MLLWKQWQVESPQMLCLLGAMSATQAQQIMNNGPNDCQGADDRTAAVLGWASHAHLTSLKSLNRAIVSCGQANFSHEPL
jgi:hypothetical protein